ncbi:hypothetical protein VM1G_11791 [Cytospora mali]|uniref:Uncharacterized protein n=1 Tax=Cytospora mali TaxID=578113 RepID=A0A194W7Z5_CYTMA|nr:hypothetical protein VM1G_11791 [Valsa mali]
MFDWTWPFTVTPRRADVPRAFNDQDEVIANHQGAAREAPREGRSMTDRIGNEGTRARGRRGHGELRRLCTF